MKNLLLNWKTTSAGLTMIITSIVHLIFQVRSHEANENAWTIALLATLGGLGLIFAGDSSGSVKKPAAETDATKGTNGSPPLPLILLPFLIGSLLIATPGCAFIRNSTPQKIAVTSIGTVQTATIAAFDGYMDAVIKGTLKTNGVPKVSAAFNHFQSATLVALDGVQFSTNALAPASLVITSQDVLNLIANWSK
jgi:hypothetical protein